MILRKINLTLKMGFVLISTAWCIGCAGSSGILKSQSSDFGPNVSQVVIVYQELDSYRLEAWQLKKSRWKMVLACPANVGRNGVALAGDKKEGDGKTPSGLFALRRAFGYEDSVKTGLNYRKVTEQDFWIDDVNAPDYNQWVQAPSLAKSFEKLRRDDHLYKYAVVIEYNTQPIVAGNGSAIFLHIWRGKNIPTAGCVAISEQKIKRLLSWLDLNQNPVILIQ